MLFSFGFMKLVKLLFVGVLSSKDSEHIRSVYQWEEFLSFLPLYS